MLPELIKALLKPEAYPEKPGKIELVQTQMSFVFLTEKFVYKVKKPVDLGYLDYSTLEKRHFYCQKELELNRRLCPETYLGVVPVTQDKGAIRIGERGEAMEYAVKMRRLPGERMLNVLLAADGVTAEMIAGVAQKLVAFHKQAATGAEINTFGKIRAVTTNTDENFDQTEKYIGKTISKDNYKRIREYTDSFVERNTALFNKRIKESRIRDCHGDLHAAHICFADGVCIYDCIEFNDRFRYCDVASEMAFLAMDLDHYGRADLSRALINDYVTESGDGDILKLLNFYKCYRAYVRGKVESFKLDDPYISREEKEKTLDTAKRYFELAKSYT